MGKAKSDNIGDLIHQATVAHEKRLKDISNVWTHPYSTKEYKKYLRAKESERKKYGRQLQRLTKRKRRR